MTTLQPALLFVYNADGGLWNALKDAVWKLTAPQSYPCSLCALTYGAVAMHGAWRRYLDGLPIRRVFHHRDDFASAYPGHGIALPAIVLRDGAGQLQVLVPAEELDAMPDLGALIAALQAKLDLISA